MPNANKKDSQNFQFLLSMKPQKPQTCFSPEKVLSFQANNPRPWKEQMVIKLFSLNDESESSDNLHEVETQKTTYHLLYRSSQWWERYISSKNKHLMTNALMIMTAL